MIAAPKHTSKRSRSVLMALPVAFALVAAGLLLYRQSLATPLRKAVAKQDPDAVAHLLRLGASPNAADGEGRTALSEDLAPDFNQNFGPTFPARRAQVAELLLKAGADPNGIYSGSPYLFLALNDQSLTSVRALLSHGADPNITCSQSPALMTAVYEDAQLHSDGKEAQPLFTNALLAAGADARVHRPHVGEAGQYSVLLEELPLLAAVRDAQVLYQSQENGGAGVSEGDAPLVETLLAHGADVNGRDHDGETALFLAAGQGDPADVRVLLAHGAAPGVADHQEQTPLQAAREAESKQLAQAWMLNEGDWQTLAVTEGLVNDFQYMGLANDQRYRNVADTRGRYDTVIGLLIAASAKR